MFLNVASRSGSRYDYGHVSGDRRLVTSTSVRCFVKQIRSADELVGDRYFIFKHSNRCPISSRAERVVSGVEEALTVPVYLVIVHDERDLSQGIAADLKVQHESPQLILVDGGKAVWHASHYDITEDAIREASSG